MTFSSGQTTQDEPATDCAAAAAAVGYSYRGGFSTSICDGLFAREDVHSDCCALTCCGVFLYDRNVFLLTDKRPSWKGRCCTVLCLLLMVLLWIIVATVSYAKAPPEEQGGKDGEEEPSASTTTTSSSTEEPEIGSRQIESLLFGLMVGTSFYYLYQAAHHRFYVRRLLMGRMYQERTASSAEDPEDDTEVMNATSSTPLVVASARLDEFLKLQERNIHSATAICGCIPKDGLLVATSNTDATTSSSNQDHKYCGGTDFCHCLWKSLSAMCCGACCGCWCQCLGLCAMGQEDRELQRMIPREQFQMDYITFQPFDDYAPRLEALRHDKINNILAHFRELSQLSKHLIRFLLIALGALTIIAFSNIDPFFRPIHILVFLMVFLQAFVIVFFVHWLFNRFDLSFDAIVKYFASGFILCTTNAFVYEMLVSTTLSVGGMFVRIVVATFMLLTGHGGEQEDATDDWGVNNNAPVAVDDAIGVPDEESPVQSVPIWILVIDAFLNAFAVAAMVEEITKYFGWRMLEHPDLLVPDNNLDSKAAEHSVPLALSTDRNAARPSHPAEQRTMKSLGAGITVAMVTTAVGFACCENFMYVFLYSRPASPATEISTLIARSLFPVHPLAAAIQSIGVCRRDIEKDKSIGLGWILLPALLLHGSFDFALMFLDLLIRSSGANNTDNNGGDGDKEEYAFPTTVNAKNAPPLDEPSLPDDASLRQQIPGLVSSVSIVLVGIIYYGIKAIAQRRRLEELDRRRQGKGEYEQLQ